MCASESDLDEYASAEPDFSTAQLLSKMGITLKVQAIVPTARSLLSGWANPQRKPRKCAGTSSPLKMWQRLGYWMKPGWIAV